MMDEFDKTIPPQRPADNDHLRQMEMEEAQTMAPRRERKTDGRFEPGDLIMGRYKVLAELGQGGMGVVYRCFDEIAGVEIALKALPPELSHNSLEMEDIKENFQLVHNLHHPNIASSNTLEKNPENGNYYLIMECCEGEDLRHWIKRKRKDNPLTLNDVLPVIRQVAEALDYAHGEKVMHRDIKPGNIMLDSRGKVKVLDFGLAAQIHTSMTRVSMAYHGTSGTGPYMAPEQWRGRQQGAAADQYALAVMTYEMLAGHLPFESTDPAVLREAVLNETAEEIADLPVSAQNAIKRAMSKDPKLRFASCREFFTAMVGVAVSPVRCSGVSPAARRPQQKPAVAVKKKAAKKVSDDPMDDPEYVAMLKRKKMKMNLIVFSVCFGITLLLVSLFLGLKFYKTGKADPAENDKAQNSATAKGKSNKEIPQAAPVEKLTEVQEQFNKRYTELMKVKESDPGKFEEERLNFCSYFQEVAETNSLTKKQLLQYNELAKEFGLDVEVPEETASGPLEVLTDVQKEFNKKYAELMKVKESDPGKFDEAKLDFISYFSGVAQANGLTRAQLLQYNELAKDFGMEVEVPEETASGSGAEDGENTAVSATPGGNPEKSKEYEDDYKKLSKYLNANGKVTDRHTKPADIMDELDKQLGMMREFMEKWETFPKTETEQKYYDNIIRLYRKTQQSRDMYSM